MAKGDIDLQLITLLTQHTGADVAASDDSTGEVALGGVRAADFNIA